VSPANPKFRSYTVSREPDMGSYPTPSLVPGTVNQAYGMLFDLRACFKIPAKLADLQIVMNKAAECREGRGPFSFGQRGS
jgi:hypothetical protein